MTKIIACDGKPITRQNFKGILGVVLEFENPRAFQEQYDKFLDKLFSEKGIPRPRKVIKSYYLLTLFGEHIDNVIQFLDEFVLFLKQQKVKINIVYTTFNRAMLSEVNLYGISSPVKKINIAKFINILSHYYPQVAVWRLSKETDLSTSEIFMDSFEGEITKSWREIESYNLSILPCGDQCNSFISLSDILFKNKLKLHENDIKPLFDKLGLVDKKDYNVYFCGQPQLSFIVPITTRKIP